MSHAYIIEIAGEAAGLVISDMQGYIFHAARPDYRALDGGRFRSPGQAERAAARLHASRLPPRQGVA